MGSDNSIKQPQTIFAGTQTTSNNVGDSRLLVDSNNIRNALLSRNLYTPDNEYLLNNRTIGDKVVGAINSIISTVAPFNSFNLKNTVYGRLVTNNTPLTEIGLVMLGKQFMLNSMSHIVQQTFPVVKPSNLFDGNKDTKLFTKKINYSITKKEEITKFQQFLDNVIYYYPNKDNPFTYDSNNSDYIKNTGTGQLSFLYSLINKNIFKQNDSTLYKNAIESGNEIQSRNSIMSERIFFNINSNKFNPYISINPKEESIQIANNDMKLSYSLTVNDNWKQEYAPNNDFVKESLGKTIIESIEKFSSQLGNSNDTDVNNWINIDSEFSDNLITSKVVWGRDGVNSTTFAKLSQLQGVSESEVIKNNKVQDLQNNFKIKTGLLAYTKNLINANEGQIGDITRKAFIEGDKLIGFNGSGIWKAPSTSLEEFRGRTGIRQHSALDQYDRFAKAIRFNGNKIYQGNTESVIYNSVLPRIHPTIDREGKINNKNLMFSIENLAIGVISKEKVGIIDDEYGSPIPLSEVGPFNGRIMWFPPYNMEINETSTAKFEPTVMIGRNEPMYNYINSERGATLNFTLIVDYPEQLKNYKGSNKQKEIAEFFAFGGDPVISYGVDTIENLELKESNLLSQIEKLQGRTDVAEEEIKPTSEISIIFPNDVPTIQDNVTTIIDKMYLDYTYEIMEEVRSSDGTGYGLNKNIYFLTGLTQIGETEWTIDKNLIPNFSQYTQKGISDQFGNVISKLDKTLLDVFSNEYNRPLYDIVIYGNSSKLYTELNALDTAAEEDYNEKLGLRRAYAAYYLISARILTLFGKTVENCGIKISVTTNGSTKSDVENATKSAIPNKNTKQERNATIRITRNERTPEPKKTQISEETRINVAEKQKEIEAIQTKINKLKSTNGDNIYNERTSSESNGIGDTGILGGFKSVSGNYYYPAFHSQTPEDFHKRLTFLQQCTRQGSAKRYDVVNENGTLRARNSVFGRQPICILRVGDFFYTKVVIENITVDYNESTWDMNPEGFGMQPMMAKVTLQMKLIGGQSLKGPIDALQNAVSFNYYANSTYSNKGMYSLPSKVADSQESYMKGISSSKVKSMTNAYDEMLFYEQLYEDLNI